MAFVYFLIEFIITLNITDKAPMFGKKLNEEMWTIKVCLWVVLSILFVFVGDGFFSIVAEIAKYLGSIFVFIMIVTLIDFLYKWSAHWAKIYDDGAQIFAVIMILTSVFLYGMCIWFTYKNFEWFYNGNDVCDT